MKIQYDNSMELYNAINYNYLKIDIKVGQTGNNNFSLQTPAKISISRATESLVIICESSISGSFGVVASPFISPAFIANVGVGGLVGATIDVVNNKARAYPSSIDIEIPLCSRTKK